MNPLQPAKSELPAKPFSFAPKSLGELMEFAKLVADSQFVPTEYRGRPGDIVVAIQTGAELGLSPMQALQSVSVINGRPSVWGDGALALVRASGLMEDFEEKVMGLGDQRFGYCRVKRKGQASPIEKRFSIDDARRAGLWQKRGPWTQYPERMLIQRARGFALRDGFADVLRGLVTREEAQDLPTEKEQARGPESDLPWTTRLSERGKVATPDEEVAAAMEVSLAAQAEGTAPNDSPEAVGPLLRPEDESGPQGVSGSTDTGAAPSGIPPPWPDEPVLITEKERRHLHACRSRGKHTEEQTKRWLLKVYGITSTANVQRAWLEAICARLEDPEELPE